MTIHCAVACPVVTEAVKAATPESKIAMAIAAIESDKISIRDAAERFGVPNTTLQRKTPTDPVGSVGVLPPTLTKGKDGIKRLPPAKPEEIARAWAMRESGMKTPAIAKELGRGEQTVRNWFAKEAPKANQQDQSYVEPRANSQNNVSPSSDVLVEPPIDSASNPPQTPPKAVIPKHLLKFHLRESRRFKEKWEEAALNLRTTHDIIKAEHLRLNNEYAGPNGSKIMQSRWQQLAQAWSECCVLDQFAEITDKPSASTLEGLLEEMERASRMTHEWIKRIQTYIGFTECLTRYKVPSAGNLKEDDHEIAESLTS